MVNRIAVAPLLCGVLAILLGFMPGILDVVVKEIDNFRESLFWAHPSSTRQYAEPAGKQRHWLIGIGVVFLVFGTIASISN